jgi:hypothetical protein
MVTSPLPSCWVTSGTKAWASRPRFTTNSPAVVNIILLLLACNNNDLLQALNSLHRRITKMCRQIIAREKQSFVEGQIHIQTENFTEVHAKKIHGGRHTE